MKLKNILLLVLVLCMVFALCACGKPATNGSDETPAPSSTNETTEATIVDDGKVTYTVTVVDEEGNPIADAMVQLCLEACIPALTDADGIATYRLAEANYKVSFISMPEGYTSDVNEFYFEAGKYEMTITLKAA